MLKHATLFALFIIVLQCAFNTTYASESLEYQLATLNAGTFVPKDHITVARFRSLLSQLSSTYVENKEQIGDMSYTSQQLLRKEGIEEKLLNVMEGMNQLFSTRDESWEYLEYISAYVTLRKKGRSHSEAIRGLQALLRAVGVY